MESITNPLPKPKMSTIAGKAPSTKPDAASAIASKPKVEGCPNKPRRTSFEKELAKLVSEIQQCKENPAPKSARKKIRHKDGKLKKENGPEHAANGRTSNDVKVLKKEPQEKCSPADGNCQSPQGNLKTKVPKSAIQKRMKALRERGSFKKKVGSNLNGMLNGKDSGGKSEKEKQTFRELGKLVSSKRNSAGEQPLRDNDNSSSNRKKKKSGISQTEPQTKSTKAPSKNLSICQTTENQKSGPSSQKSTRDNKSERGKSPQNRGIDSFAGKSNKNKDFGKKAAEATVVSDVGKTKESPAKDKKGKEVRGSYSLLLQSIDEPLLYRPAEEIASLLSPMAYKSGPNQKYSPRWKNGDNFQGYNRQNQRPTFHQGVGAQQANRNLGHCFQNPSPVKKGPHQNPNSKNNNSKQNGNESCLPFEDYWPVDQQTFQNPNLIVGQIRVNPKDYQECYISHPDGHSDVFISGMKNRNRAFNGDIVVVLLDDQSKWRVNKEEFDSDFNPDCDSCDNTIQHETQSPQDIQASVSSPDTHLSNQFQRLNISMQKTQTSVANETKDTTTLNAVDPNIKKTPKKKDNQIKKYTCIADLNDDNQQKVLANTSHKYIQRTGKVVAIYEKKHSRLCVGHLQMMSNKKVKFNPSDSRLPRIMIPLSECPKEFVQRPETFSKVLFVAKVKEWATTDMFASGNLLKKIGDAGEIETETEGILIENDVDFSEFSEESLASLPLKVDQPWTIPSEEYSKRRDFTNTCVFTIDPVSARDLDDAVSCDKLENGLYEIGVHIADVTYFLKENSELDKIASSRATSVYLVQKVIPMLPRILCEQLCSLNPGQPRLTFSVVWHMNDKAEIVNEWFGRSVINSCVKMSYAHAQGFIEEPQREFTEDQLPEIHKFSAQDIKERVLTLCKLSKILRKKRFDDGALRLDQVKLQWVLDKETGQPTGISVYERKDSNQLIEEYMLLANMAVAHRIYKAFPDKSFLRRHPEPQTKMIENLNDISHNLDIPIDTSSAGGINKSLEKYLNIGNDDDEYAAARMQVLVSMCSKPMKLAVYFCTGILKDESKFWHYALNVPLYTHFTSPIRRYADVIVHRLLAAALDYSQVTGKDEAALEKIAEHCNDKKSNSKRVQELSNEIYFAAFVKEVGPLHEKGMVMSVLDHAFDVLILKYGIIKRVYCNKLNLANHTPSKRKKIPILHLHWNREDSSISIQEICVFTLVNCILKTDAEPLRWTAVIKPPKL